MSKTKKTSLDQYSELLGVLRKRFEKNMKRHKDLDWEKIEAKLQAQPAKLATLDQMELTGGEPDVIGYDKKANAFKNLLILLTVLRESSVYCEFIKTNG